MRRDAPCADRPDEAPRRARRRARRLALALLVAVGLPSPAIAQQPDRARVLDAMKRATKFMVDEVSTDGGYVWSYLPDRSRRWGELEARDTMIWIQPPGTATMGHLFLDAYNATGDDDFYRAADRAARALLRAQYPSGGWNYLADFAGPESLAEWYATIGRNAWRLEEFQYDWGNATFDDQGTAESARLLLRLSLARKDPAIKAGLDRAIQFVLDSQYPNGTWPQRHPPAKGTPDAPLPEYPSYMTFNDDVADENVKFLIQCYQAFGDERLLDPIRRGMRAFAAMQQPAPQAGWALQYTPGDLQPAGARTYEPKALVTHTTARNIEVLMEFYELTGDASLMARIPEALAWLDRVRLPAELATSTRTHPTFVEIGTNRPLYVHREGSNVESGRYYVDHNPEKTLGHYSSFRRVDTEGLRRRYEALTARDAEALRKTSPLRPGAPRAGLPRFFVVDEQGAPAGRAPTVASVLESLTPEGFWLAPLGYTSHVYKGPAPKTVAPGDFSQTHVGDEYDTSPFRDETLTGISTAAFIRNMSVLIRALD